MGRNNRLLPFVFLSVFLLVMASHLEAYAQARSFAQTGPGGTSSGATIPAKDGSTNFAKAQPEDITNENFPNLIESFDYPNAEIADIVKAISKLTGKNFIIDKGISGKISIIAPTQITVAEAYKAFLTALAMNQYTVVPSGNFLKITSIQTASKGYIDTYAGNYFPNTDQLITRIIKLKYINAEEVQKTLRPLINQYGDITPYQPTNSLIVTDLGSNVECLVNIINQLDVPGFEEKLVVIPIKFARAKDIAELIDQIINKGEKNKGNFSPGIPRFRSGSSSSSSGSSGAASYDLVIPDNRTNSIIVVGNDAGIERIRSLVAKLDFKLRPEDAGGVNVYYVRHGEAEKIANVLNGIASESAKTKSSAAAPATSAAGGGAAGAAPAAVQAVFGGDVKVAADKDNNALIITCSKQDYEIVRSILAKIDIPRDQVYVKAVIMEMNADGGNSWGINYFTFKDGTNGAGRAGFVSADSVSSLLTPANDKGLVLGFGSKNIVTITGPNGTDVEVPDLLGLIKFIKTSASGNILSTPQITALDNEEALIEVGENVPVGLTTSSSTGGAAQQGVERQDLTLSFKITPYISPDTDSVRLKIDQKIKQISQTTVQATELASRGIAYSTRTIQTNLVVNSNDTAVIGGLMQDQEGENVTKVPILGDIPIIGWLFKGKSDDKKKKNLVVFITPKILRNSQDSSDLVDSKLNERVDFIQQNMRGRDPHGYEIDRLPRRAVVNEPNQEFIEEAQTSPLPDTAPTEEGGSTDQPQELPGDYEEGE